MVLRLVASLCPLLQLVSGDLHPPTPIDDWGGANGQGFGAMGEVHVRGFIGKIKVQFKAVDAQDARRYLLSGTQLRTKGYTFSLNHRDSFLNHPKDGQRVTMSREGNRATLKVVCLLEPKETQSSTSLMLKRELESVKQKLWNLKTRHHENT